MKLLYINPNNLPFPLPWRVQIIPWQACPFENSVIDFVRVRSEALSGLHDFVSMNNGEHYHLFS